VTPHGRRTAVWMPGLATIFWALVACGRESSQPANRAGATSSAAGHAPAPSAPAAAWTVTEAGWGPVRAGMRTADARAALGGALPEPRNHECDHVRPPAAPAGVLLMVVRGEIARVEVRDTTVSTAAGARVGDSEARVEALYPGRMRRSPHKYVDGHYLVVRRGAGPDSLYRLVFETDGRQVTRFRAGRLPEVEWVEGCG